ncbi:MAG: protein phosphatase 2C domain-containing protein [Synergistes sp.]|nr:protein phosphatase 2C domain-containing protein [Synergistes sp.]
MIKNNLKKQRETAEEKMKISVSVGNCQNIGRRSEQQDSFGFSDFADKELIDIVGYTGIVCDGMGGLVGGREASGTAVRSFLEAQKTISAEEETADKILLKSTHIANNAVWHLAESINEPGNCGSTLVAVAVKCDMLYWVSVGDSHIYRYRNGRLKQLNKEHIYANKLQKAVEKGFLTEEDALHHPQREALTSFIGIENLTEIDEGNLQLRSEDTILLCSDGLYKTLSEEEIAESYEGDPQKWTEKLISITLSKENSHQDNVTAIAITVKINGQNEPRTEEIPPMPEESLKNSERKSPKIIVRKRKIPTMIIVMLCIFAVLSGVISCCMTWNVQESEKENTYTEETSADKDVNAVPYSHDIYERSSDKSGDMQSIDETKIISGDGEDEETLIEEYHSKQK